jgi:hypothetical protein
MLSTIKSIALALLLCCTAHSTHAAAATTFVAGMAVSGIVEQLKTSIQQIIDQLDNRVSARTFQLRADLVVLQSEVANSADALVGKTFGELSKQQQTFFEGAANTVSQAGTLVSDTTKSVETIATQVEQALAQIPFFGSEPRVRRSSPSFVKVMPASAPEVTFAIDGSFLKHGDAAFNIGGAACKVVGHIESRATFTCPATAFAGPMERVKYVTGTLVVSLEQSVWQKLTSFFGGKAKTKTYQLPVAVVPSVLGKYSVQATHLTETAQTQPRRGNWGRTNDHCVGRQSFQYNFGPSGTGWKILVDTVSATETCGRGGQGHAIRNLSEAGFQIESWSSNSGRCERVLGSIVSRDARGCSSGYVTWTERNASSTPQTTVIGTGDLEWGKAVTLTLPPRIVGVLVTVDQIDGQRVALNSAIGSRWFSVSRDAASTSLVLSPLELSRALAQ